MTLHKHGPVQSISKLSQIPCMLADMRIPSMEAKRSRKKRVFYHKRCHYVFFSGFRDSSITNNIMLFLAILSGMLISSTPINEPIYKDAKNLNRNVPSTPDLTPVNEQALLSEKGTYRNMRSKYARALSMFNEDVYSEGHTNEPYGDKSTGDKSTGDKSMGDKSMEDTYNETMEAEVSLSWLVGHMQSFIHDTNFDVRGFENDFDSISHSFAEISSSARKAGKDNVKLMKQLSFTTRMFQTMHFAMKNLRLFDIFASTEDALINYMMELNVKLLGFYSGHGHLDLEHVDYKNQLLGCWLDMYRWTEHFRSLKEVPKVKKMLFEEERSASEITVADLWNQVPWNETEGSLYGNMPEGNMGNG
ncbi:hypothetical protein JCM33374_g5099 [Metschnikowia sp. JCM 33374]|nr:hypothetical protein JCM33374_g5099 [Metschnikowia sp. JCM 33374]